MGSLSPELVEYGTGSPKPAEKMASATGKRLEKLQSIDQVRVGVNLSHSLKNRLLE